LVSSGLLTRKQGTRTYVAEPKVEHDIRFLVSFTESSLRKGINPTGKIVLFDQLEADVNLSQFLQVSLGKKVYRLIRVRYADYDPLVLEKCFFPAERYPGIEQFDVENQSLYHIWKDEYGISFGRMRQTLEPVGADETAAQLLNVPAGFPLMLVERVTFDVKGIPIEYAKDLHRSDRSRFVSDVLIKQDENT
jgi:GntR family transcriptional regulator